MQRHGLVTALRRSGVPDVVAAGSVGLSIAVGPSVGVALGDRGFVYLTVVDGEVQGFSTWATLSGGGVEDVVATSSVGLSVVGPSVGVALGDGIIFLLAVVDGEVEGDGLVAALRRGGVPDIVAAGGVGLPVTVSPGVGVAFGDRGLVLLAVIDGEV